MAKKLSVIEENILASLKENTLPKAKSDELKFLNQIKTLFKKEQGHRKVANFKKIMTSFRYRCNSKENNKIRTELWVAIHEIYPAYVDFKDRTKKPSPKDQLSLALATTTSVNHFVSKPVSVSNNYEEPLTFRTH